ncbi:MAG: gamma-glutamyl-gamma-aminobutyrate hydrolase family protein [Acidimicrobiales bacterium]|nr:gamma-glutamyl-gamma-aminobutyrate hydrolase family protein [Acidimicrobiales bacterium]
MTTKPLIGITGKRRKGEDLRGNLRVMNALSFDLFWVDYAEGILAAGGMPVFLPLGLDPEMIVERLDGILMSGGADISPALYGAEPQPELGAVEPVRDQFELDLLKAATERELPVAGICRGLQILNVYAGGNLFQDIPPHAVRDKPPTTRVHEVTIEKGSVLEDLYGSTTQVNSLHHQSIDRVGKGFVVTARSEDTGVEGIEHEDLPIIAVQWHPEMLDTRDNDPLFKWLVDQAMSLAS